jgi:tetratricopeptide (TPR) repeat protein
MKYDFNVLETAALRHSKAGRYREALAIYFWMADGDPSLDAGHLARRIAECYEALSELPAARYWYGRAIEENPVVNAGCADARAKLGNTPIDSLIAPEDGTQAEPRRQS